MQISNYLLDVMESNETDAQAVDYMRDMYKGCMDEGKWRILYRYATLSFCDLNLETKTLEIENGS